MASLSHILMLCAVITVGFACQPNIVRRTTTRRPTTRSTTTTTTTTSIPTGPPATDPAKERTFALEIQPPLSWSYPFTDDQTRLRRATAEKQATSCADAENRIREALEETINEITQENNRFSSVTVNLTSKSCLQANIATLDGTLCKATGNYLHVVLDGYTIVGTCDTTSGKTLPLSHKVDGLLISEKLLQNNDWDFMASKLQTSLSKYNLIVNRLTLKSPDHKIFKMTIQPPVSWSYPPSEDKKIALRAPRSTKVQAFSFDEARQNVITALQTQMNETIDDLQSLNLPGITVGLAEGLPVAARIVKLVSGKCPNVTNATLTVIDPDGGWRIWQQCNGTSEYPTNISIEVTGTLFPQNKSAAISELNWKMIAADLQNGLQYVEKVKFIKDITLEDGVPAAVATTAVSEEPTGAPETSEATTEEKTKGTNGETTVSPSTELTTEETTEMYPIEEAGEERTFSMEILPPVTWTFPYPPSKRIVILAEDEPSEQASDVIAARKKVIDDIKKELTDVISANKIPTVYFVINEGVPLEANLVDSDENNQCVSIPGQTTVISDKKGKFIESSCNKNEVELFSPLLVTGSFYTARDEQPLSAGDWSSLETDLQKKLESNVHAQFKKDLKIDIPEQKVFSMAIQPLISWSYSPTAAGSRRRPRSTDVQAASYAEARQNVLRALQSKMNAFTEENKLPTIKIDVTKGLPLAANIVDKCSSAKTPNFRLSDNGRTISQKCDDKGNAQNFDLPVTGTMISRNNALMTEVFWDDLTFDLQNGLETDGVVFQKNLTLKDRTIMTTTAVVSTTKAENTSPNEGKTTIFEVTTTQGEGTVIQTDATVGGETTVTNGGTSTEMSPIPSSESSSASNQTADSRKFSMEVQPPAAWSYPFTEDVTNDYGQAKTCEEAEERILAAFNAIIKVTADIDLQAVSAIVASGACLQANIATISSGICTVSQVSPLAVLLSQDGTIEKACDAITGESGSFAPKKVEGSLVSEKVLTMEQWEYLAQTLIDSLEKDYHVIFNTKLTLESSMVEPDKGSGNEAPQRNVDLIAADFSSSNDKERATFIMTVQPPAIWTYPSQIKFLRDDLQKKDEVEARKEIHNAIERAMYRVLKGYNIPEELLTVEINHNVKIAADIVDRSDLNTCTSVSDNSIVLNSYGKTIESSCSRNGKMKPYNQAFIRGTFKAELAASDDMWQILAVELKDQLEAKEDVIFPKGSTIIIKPF